MSIASESKYCPTCGAPIIAEAPQGLCPKCLLAAVSLPTEAGAPGKERSAPPPLEAVAAAFPHLEILELFGQGGMGFVFKARQPKLDRFVALKILPQSLAADPAFAERFTREGRMLARLGHPNIVTIHDFGQANGFFYLLMEFVDGVNLRQAMKAGRFTPGQALAVVPSICEALQYAHNEGILHRDIKPENILLDSRGRVKIADFGIAKLIGEPQAEAALTASGAALGTAHYMAPEQIERPSEVDHRADIYSLGVVFYEMLTGELPLGRFAPPSEKSASDPRLDDVVLRALAKEPRRRTQSAGEVKTQVETIAAAPQSPTMRMSASSLPRKGMPFWAKAGLAAAVVVVVGGVLLSVPILMYLWTKAGPKERPSVAATNLAAASAERWAPSLEPGKKPDPGKILSEASELTVQGRHEEALQRFLWYHNHALEIDSGLSGTRLSSALREWMELGRRYPKAKQALIEVRDRNVREFAEDRGHFDLFMDVRGINRELQEEEATYQLFMSIHRVDPALARHCYWATEDLVAQRGEYELCRHYMGDYQERFARIREAWEMSRKMEQRWEEQRKNAAQDSIAPRLPAPQTADDRFVEGTRQLIEILVGTGSKPEAEKIRAQAIVLVDDPRLQTAIEDAEKRIATGPAHLKSLQPKAKSTSDVSATFERLHKQYESRQAEAEAKAEAEAAGTNVSASAELWAPSLEAGGKPDVDKIRDEARNLASQGRYEEALQRHIWYHNHALEYGAGQTGVRLSFALADWIELGRRYPKAKQALIENRNRATRAFAEGRGYFGLFQDVHSINDYLQKNDATYALFMTVHKQDPELARQCFAVAEGLLVEKGEYELCLSYMGDYQKRFEKIRDLWEMNKKSEETMRQGRETLPSARLRETPQWADDNFVQKTCRLIVVLVGAGKKAEAEKIREQAVAILDDPRLKSAVADAEKKVGQ